MPFELRSGVWGAQTRWKWGSDEDAKHSLRRHLERHPPEHPSDTRWRPRLSIERIYFGKEYKDKGSVWTQVEKGHTTYAFRAVPVRRFNTALS
jgi:hypothetical protein